MAIEFKKAPEEVRRIGSELIADYHRHLVNVPVEYVMISENPSYKGREVLGRASKVTGIRSFFAAGMPEQYDQHEDFFLIEVAEPTWSVMEENEKRAVVDHELSHCWVDPETGKLVIRGHDLEEFGEIVRRHGFYRRDVAQFAAAVHEQLELAVPE